MKIRNVRSYARDLNGKVVEPGETIEVSDDLGSALLEQPDNWAAVTTPPKSESKES